MHDIRLIRDDPEAFDERLARRGLRSVSQAALSMDQNRREALTAEQDNAAKRNLLSKQIGQAMRDENLSLAKTLKDQASSLKNPALGSKESSELLKALLSGIPNLPAPDVPEGADESGNVEQKVWGTRRQFNYTPANHADLGPTLGLDFETGALLSGTRFTFLRGQMARLQRALGQFMLDRQTAAGFIECAPPLLVRDEAMFGTGQLPKFAEDSFETDISLDPFDYIRFKLDALTQAQAEGTLPADADPTKRKIWDKLPKPPTRRWLIPTSEVSLTNSIREQILAEDVLPIKMTALTPCFRSEAGSAGKDTRGYIRQHQFEKVELVSICRPEDSAAEHETMTLAAEAILEALGLPYRRMLLCAGDMGFAARKTYDLEVWLPGQDAWREISSISDCGDFQARRMNARYRPAKNELGGQKGTQFVHTLNGSGLAVGRTLVAVLENYQQEDGSVDIPEALVSYMGGVAKLTPAA